MTGCEWRKLLRKNHICRQCKRQDAYTLAGHPLCFECTEKDRINQRNRRAKDGGEKNRKRSQRIRDERVAAGLCTYCGKRMAPPGRSTCITCSTKQKERNRQREIERGMNWPRGANGYCWQCNKRMAIEGKRLCQECYDKLQKNCRKKEAVP